jgi:hypothetical protein
MPENQQPGSGDPGGQNDQQQAPLVFDTWIAAQGDEIKSLLDGHTKGLRTALDSERTQRKEFERQLREATGKLEKDSDARKQLETLSSQLEAQGRQAEFYETAHAAGVSNLRLAWVALQQDAALSDRSGRVDWKRFQEQYPELFGGAKQKAPAGNAGAGTQNPPGKAGMNEFIRKAAGRG